MADTRRRKIFLFEFVTGGGMAGLSLPDGWAAEGHAMRRALADDFAAVDGCDVVMTLDERFPPEPGPWELVRVDRSTEEREFLRLVQEADDTILVAPETNFFLLDRVDAVERLGGNLLSCGSQAVRVAGSKYESFRLFQRHGLPTPPTFWRGLEDDLLADLRHHFHEPGEPGPAPGTHPLPAVLKLNHGAGSIDTFLVSRFSEMPDEAEADLFQPFVPGEPMSASFLVDREGRAWLVGQGRQRIEQEQGRLVYRGGVVPVGPAGCPATVRHSVEVLEGSRGWVGVDYIWDAETEQVALLDLNPRLTTSYVGLRRLLPAGALARVWLDLVHGRDNHGASDLPDRVHAQPPIHFDADGRFVPVSEGRKP